MLTHIAHDCQTNEIVQLFTDNPRKELIERFSELDGSCSCHPMYVDSKSKDETFLQGWIINGRWLEIYSVTPMRIKK
jgi:hypothetical protein